MFHPDDPDTVLITIGKWKAETAQWLDISTLELAGVLAAVSAFGTQLTGTSVQAVVDNQSIETTFQSCKSHTQMASILQHVHWAVGQHSIRLSVKWVPREENHVADLLSKGDIEAALKLLDNPNHSIVECDHVSLQSALTDAVQTSKKIHHQALTTPGVVHVPVQTLTEQEVRVQPRPPP